MAIPAVVNFFNTASPATVIGTTLCGAAAIEMVVRSAFDKNQTDLSANLAGAFFFGISSYNAIPLNAFISGIAFTVYSLTAGSEDRAYLTSQAIYQLYAKTYDWILKPTFDHIIFPFLEKVANVAWKILALIPLPKHPTWIGVGVLVTAIPAYKTAGYVYNRITTPGFLGSSLLAVGRAVHWFLWGTLKAA